MTAIAPSVALHFSVASIVAKNSSYHLVLLLRGSQIFFEGYKNPFMAKNNNLELCVKTQH